MFKTKVSTVKVLNLQGGFFYGILFCCLFGFVFFFYNNIAPRPQYATLFIASLIFYFLCITFMEIALVGELCAMQQEHLETLTKEIQSLKREIRQQRINKDKNT